MSRLKALPRVQVGVQAPAGPECLGVLGRGGHGEREVMGSEG